MAQLVDLYFGNEEVSKMNVKQAFVKGFALVAVVASLAGCESVSSLGGSPDLSGTWYQYQPGSTDGTSYRSGTIYKITIEKVSEHTYKMAESKYYQKGINVKHTFLNEEEYLKNFNGFMTWGVERGPNKVGVIPQYDEEHEWVGKVDRFNKHEQILTVRDGVVYSASNGATHTIKEENGKLVLESEGKTTLQRTDDSFFDEAFKQEEELIRKALKEENEKSPMYKYDVRNITFTKRDL